MNGRYFIKIDGQRLPEDVEAQVYYFEYESNERLLDRVVLRLNSRDGKMLDQYFPQGANLEFTFGPEETTMSEPRTFTIRRVEGVRHVVVNAYEAGHAISAFSRSKVYPSATPDEVAAQKARENGLQFVGDAFPVRYPQLVQVNESDMKFLHGLADRVNALCMVEGNTLYFVRKDYASRPVEEFVIDDNGGFDYRKTIAFSPVESNLALPHEVSFAGLDIATMQPFEAKAGNGNVRRTVLGPQTIQSAEAAAREPRAGQTGVRKYTAARNAVQAQQEADALFQGYEARQVEANVTLWGRTAVLANRIIRLTGDVTRYAGLYRVQKARHIIQGAYKIIACLERNATGAASGGQASGGTVNE